MPIPQHFHKILGQLSVFIIHFLEAAIEGVGICKSFRLINSTKKKIYGDAQRFCKAV